MALIDRECVRRLLESPDSDAVLVFVRGDCVVLPAGQLDEQHRRLVIADRRDLVRFTGDTVTEEQLDMLADRLENVALDLGA
ncbi:hypothetical protein GCM10010517_58950 [Streptosporangium fragile]|uniref:Uncharacterized protein n=1 Tax=Streptosporangium fragile TaxID=46186 RepID=A0ABN3W6B5_9ACTN